jgi:hypothetical protein
VAQDDNGEQYPGYGPVGDGTWSTKQDALRDCLRLFVEVEVGYGLLNLPTLRDALHGHDLMCWCPDGQPCHADELLELANGGVA